MERETFFVCVNYACNHAREVFDTNFK